MRVPEFCDICVREEINADLFRGNIELGPKAFKGTNPSVMLVGQDPTITKGQVHSVLDLENTSSLLYKYVVIEILEPIGLKLDNIYATNLVKCRFLYNQTPKTISEDHGMAIKDFLFPFFHNCRQHFFSEVRQVHPKIILAFGEPIHQLLIEEFGWSVPPKMKDAFSKIYYVSLLGDDAYYIPCIHINSRNKLHYKNLWSSFIQNSKEHVILAGVIQSELQFK